VRIDASHAGAVDSQFFAQCGNFGFQPVELGNVRIAFSNREFPAREHGNTHKTDNVQHRMSDIFGPVLRQGQ